MHRLAARLDGCSVPSLRGAGLMLTLPGLDAVTALCGGPGCRVVVWLHGRRHVSAEPARDGDHAAQLAIGLVLAADRAEDDARAAADRERDRLRGFARDTTTDRDEVRELRRRLSDPARIVHALGLGKGARVQPRGIMVRCPVHDDSTASCSVRVAKDGTIQARCHGCQWSGDVLGLIAVVRGLDPGRDFRRVIEEAARLAGVTLRETRRVA